MSSVCNAPTWIRIGVVRVVTKPSPIGPPSMVLMLSTLCRGDAGQSKWPVLFPECGGSSQSPINVDTSKTWYDPSLPELRPLGYAQYGHEPFTISNNGHTVEIPLPSWMGLAGLPWQFSAVQLHLHWGNGVGVSTGSEHSIDEQSASAELHVVHYNSELYSNISEAKTQENGLAVLAVLIEAREETNQAYANILNYLGRIRHAGQRVFIPAFDVRTLLPRDLSHYFRYSGSLTTPPCHQSVLWTVFVEKVKISHSQLLKLETVLYSSRPGSAIPKPLQDNYRTTQPFNNRTVLSSFVPVSANIYTAGEISAIVVGCLCGCVGLAVIVHFIVKTIRSMSSWNVLSSVQPPPQHSVRSTIPPQAVQQRTEEYVQTQFNTQSLAPLHNGLLHHGENPTLKTSPMAAGETPTHNIFTPSVVKHAHMAHHTPSPSPPDNQQRQYNQHPPHHVTVPPMIDFAKFLARRELVTTGLSKFDDTPESFRAWQSSFLNATQDVGLTYGEQLDLLVKWLGKESSEHIKRICAAHAISPRAILGQT
ncbi:carbonic anhydrase 14 [Neoarius graeffei]|uniref:carbonic anhydrase 14 n=1 Tax=Neoarius graeffei TaxID=443677 RepID=UPI00298C49EE|nr:carbonic anhydrase 14 [Neoarius graeffei]